MGAPYSFSSLISFTGPKSPSGRSKSFAFPTKSIVSLSGMEVLLRRRLDVGDRELRVRLHVPLGRIERASLEAELHETAHDLRLRLVVEHLAVDVRIDRLLDLLRRRARVPHLLDLLDDDRRGAAARVRLCLGVRREDALRERVRRVARGALVGEPLVAADLLRDPRREASPAEDEVHDVDRAAVRIVRVDPEMAERDVRLVDVHEGVVDARRRRHGDIGHLRNRHVGLLPARERLVEHPDDLVLRHVAADPDDRVVRMEIGRMELDEVVARDRVHARRRRFPAVRMIAVDELAELAAHDRVRLVVLAPDVLEHRLALHIDLVVGQRRVHDEVGEDLENARQILLEAVDGDHGAQIAAVDLDVRREELQLVVQLVGRPRRRAAVTDHPLRHLVETVHALVGKVGPHGEHDVDDGNLVILDEKSREPVRERELDRTPASSS